MRSFSAWGISWTGCWGDLEPGNGLPVGIDGDRGFQESFSGFTGSLGIIWTGIGAGKARWIDRGIGDSLTPIVELLNEPVQQLAEIKWVNSLREFMDYGEMGYFFEIDPSLWESPWSRGVQWYSGNLRQGTLTREVGWILVLGVDLFGKFWWIEWNSGIFDQSEGFFNKFDIPVRWFFKCLLSAYEHNKVRRHYTLDLSVVGTNLF